MQKFEFARSLAIGFEHTSRQLSLHALLGEISSFFAEFA